MLFYGLSALQLLDLSQTGLTNISDFQFAENGMLESLFLGQNLIPELSDDVFAGCSNLLTLYAHSNLDALCDWLQSTARQPANDLVKCHGRAAESAADAV